MGDYARSAKRKGEAPGDIMTLDVKTLRLIAVGASVSANCQSCLQANGAEALAAGATEQEIVAAVEVGKMVRRGVASQMDQFIASLKQETELSGSGGCNCGS